MVMDGVEFDAESVFAVRTVVELVFQREGIENREGCGEKKEEENEPADADLTMSSDESIEAVLSQDD